MNSIQGVFLKSYKHFHDEDIDNSECYNRFINESIDDLDEIKRQELLRTAGKTDKFDMGYITDKNKRKFNPNDTEEENDAKREKDKQRRYFQGTLNKDYSYGTITKGKRKGQPAETMTAAKIEGATFDIPTFEKTGDLIMIYSMTSGKASGSGNTQGNGSTRVFVRYEGVAQSASKLLKASKGDKITQKTFESAIGQALESVDVYVNCECHDFVQRFLKPAQKLGYFFDPKKYGISTKFAGGHAENKIQGTGQRQVRDYPTGGLCYHAIKALANKRDNVLRAKLLGGGDNVIGVIYDTVMNSTPNSLLHKLFIKGTNKDKSNKKMNNAYSFDNILNQAKDYLNADDINLVSSKNTTELLDNMDIEDTQDLGIYTMHSGRVKRTKVCVIETPTSIYTICDKDKSYKFL